MPSLDCPSDLILLAFQLGNLPDPALDLVANHLEGCSQCESRAQRLDGELDPILVAIRAPSTAIRPDTAPLLDPSRAIPLPPADGRAAEARYPFLRPAIEPDEIGRLGNYRVLKLLGKGGMAFVFHAEDITLRRPVALKVLRPDQIADPEGQQRFLREARIMAAIKHEHLVPVFHAGQDGDVVYLAMELLHGESLGDWMERAGAVAAAEVVRLGREIASGLAVIHRHGLVHRDIKPANVFLTQAAGSPSVGVVKILDFGLARFVCDDVNLTQPGTVIGTPAFMSPEQASGAAVDARSDLFSLGCILYCLCTGRKPFQAANTIAVLTALAVHTPRPVNEANPAVPRPLADLVGQMLAKDPGARPASAEAVLARLDQIERALGDPPAALDPMSLTEKFPVAAEPQAHSKLLASRRALITLVALLTAFVVVAAAGFVPGLLDLSGTTAPSTWPEADQEGIVFLSNLTPISRENWPFVVPKDPAGHELKPLPSPDHFKVVVYKQRISPHGLFMHPPIPPDDGNPVSLTYRVDKGYAEFRAVVSLNDGPRISHQSLTFAVYGDGGLLWQSQPVKSQEDTQTVRVPLKDVTVLKLELSCPPGHVFGSHAVWIEPHLAK